MHCSGKFSKAFELILNKIWCQLQIFFFFLISARIAKENKDRLIEEVRRHFGFQVHPKDERFKELLEKKEKEQKKALKDAKRQAKEAKMLEKIATSNKQVNEDTQKSSEGQ